MPRTHLRLRHALITVGLTTAALATNAAPVHAADPAPVTITISPAKQTRAKGADGSLLFTMTSNGTRVAGKQLAVYIRPPGTTTWTRKWTPTTNSYGQVRITYAVSRTLYVFSRFGKSLPHNSGQQYQSVRHVARSDKRVGDLIFTYNAGGIYHVAIYAGNGYIWHSPHSGDVVKKSQMWSQSYYVGRVA